MATKQSRWGEPMKHQLNELEAFDTMRAFVEAFMRRGEPNSEALNRLLSFTSRESWGNGQPMDIAQWEDWLDAIETTKKG